MTTHTTTLDAWRAQLASGSTCPWPGPRPLRAEEETQLVGRAKDCEDFATAVTHYRLVVLHGPSGLGKSSLLNAGLMPTLRRQGFLVGTCDLWNAAGASPEDFLADHVRESLAANASADGGAKWGQLVEFLENASPEVATGHGLFETLSVTAGGKAIIVLDQFEELLRCDDPDFRRQLFRAVAHIVDEIGLRVVISLRSEYLYALRELFEQVSPLTQRQFPLLPIDKASAIALVRDPLAERASTHLDPATVDSFATFVGTSWAKAQQGSDDRIGLLHLQAMLFTLWEHGGGDVATFSTEHLTDFLDDLEPGLGDEMREGLTNPFERVLTAAAEVKIDECRTTVELFNPELADATYGVLLETFPHLSSDGYKVPRRLDDLAVLTLDDELVSLERAMRRPRDEHGDANEGRSGEQFTALVVAIAQVLNEGSVDLLTTRASAILDEVDRIEPGLAVLELHEPGAEPWNADPRDQTAGAMLGVAPVLVLTEVLRRFCFAITWLEKSDVVRITTAADGDTIVTLIHDRYADALKRIADHATQSALPEATGLVRATAVDIVGPGGAPRTIEGSVDRPLLIINQRWPAGWIHAQFKHVVFMNCDLSSTGFGGCTFEGVAFVNCILDGAAFIDCDVRGPRPPLDHHWSDSPSSFFVAGATEAALHARYREFPEGTYDGFFSDEGGLPAVPHPDAATPVGSPEHPVSLAPIQPPAGSLAFYGGRLSTLAFRFVTCVDDAWITFRHCGGSGLDIVGQEFPVNLQLYGSALRHVAITSCPLDPEGGTMQLEVEGSKLYQAWIGQDIPGEMRASDSVLVHVFNSSPNLHATLSGASSGYLGLVGVDLCDEGDGLPTPIADNDVPLAIDVADPSPTLRIRGETDMDYRQSDSEGRRTHKDRGIGEVPRWGEGDHAHHEHDHGVPDDGASS